MTIGRHHQPHPDRRFGNIRTGDYSEFEDDGTFRMRGNATAFLDEIGQLTGQKLQSPSAHITDNASAGCLNFDNGCSLSDWVSMSVQFNHDRKVGADVYPHVHWWQQHNTYIPNWLLGYRWQVAGQAFTLAFTNKKWVSHAFTYASGTLNQITTFGPFTPPATDGVSSILQIRLYRDCSNASGLFSGAEPPGAVTEYAVSLDIHKECDTVGSRSQYSK